MTMIATCSACTNDVELTADNATLVIYSLPRPSFYEYRCPYCIEDVRKVADDYIIALLVSSGIRPQRLTTPAEALEPHEGAPFSYDELLDFVLALGRTDYLSPLAEAAYRA
jgi:hypothetical protein